MGIFHQLIKLLASGFYAGYSPLAPGTAGSLVGVLAYLLLQTLPDAVYIAVVVFILAAGIYIAGEAEALYQKNDSPRIVIDEIAGMLLTFAFLPKGVNFLLSGFIAFRLFDILKPFPARQFERGFHGGLGIMADDMMAGVYGNLTVRGFGWLAGWI